MANETQITLSGQIAALVDAVGGWQAEAMKALNDAITAVGGVDQTLLISLINQHLARPGTLNEVVAAVVSNAGTTEQIEQLISQYSAAEIAEAVRTITLYLPDISAATGTGLADDYVIGQAVTFTPSGASTASGAPVIWQLTDLVGVTASATEVADGESVQLTFTGPGSMTITAVANGIAAESITRSWGASAAVMGQPRVTSPAAGTKGLALQPVITASAYSVSPSGYDTHQRSQCRVLNRSGAVLWDSGMVSARTEFAVSTDLVAETAVDIQVRHEGSRLGWGQWSPSVRVTTRQAGGPGVVYPDGGIGGPVVGGYRLIVASKSQRGQNIKHGLYGMSTSLTDIIRSSTPDPQSGYDNTNTLINGYSGVNDGQGSVGPVAAQFCRNLGSEWYLPSKDELAAIVAMADEIDAADSSNGLSFADIGTGWIWSSTEYSTYTGWVVRASDGHIYSTNRPGNHAVVPVRRVSL